MNLFFFKKNNGDVISFHSHSCLQFFNNFLKVVIINWVKLRKFESLERKGCKVSQKFLFECGISNNNQCAKHAKFSFISILYGEWQLMRRGAPYLKAAKSFIILLSIHHFYFLLWAGWRTMERPKNRRC
jgi:hypothetical protein